jgi:hypothetical protein
MQELAIPEGFGNPWMANLDEIGLPDPVAMTPQTAGWAILAGLVVALVIWFAWRAYGRWRAAAYRREALGRIDAIEAAMSVPDRRRLALAALPPLLKRTALAAYPRAQVASLTGETWLAFLDGTIGATEFSRGPGRLLLDLAFAPPGGVVRSEAEARELLSLMRRWVRRHRAGAAFSDTGVARGE